MTPVIVSDRPLQILLVTVEDDYAPRVAALLDAPELVRATGIDDALDRLARTAVDCVVLDLEPSDPGTESVARIRAASPQTAVVVLTAHADDALKARVTSWSRAQRTLARWRTPYGPRLCRRDARARSATASPPRSEPSRVATRCAVRWRPARPATAR
jgi:CheY-like chemotaxis protein